MAFFALRHALSGITGFQALYYNRAGAIATLVVPRGASDKCLCVLCLLFFFSPGIRADFWEGDATKRFSVKKGFFSEKRGGNSVSEGFGKDSTGKAIQ